jgi:hypothetical protein
VAGAALLPPRVSESNFTGPARAAASCGLRTWDRAAALKYASGLPSLTRGQGGVRVGRRQAAGGLFAIDLDEDFIQGHPRGGEGPDGGPGTTSSRS